MRFSIQREAFLRPLKAVAGVVEKRHTHHLPILSHVLIQVGKDHFSLTTTDQEVELIARGNLEQPPRTPGSITVSFRKLMDICRALPEGAFLDIAEEGERIIIRSGRSRVSLSPLPARDFPNLNEAVGDTRFSVVKRALRALIDSTSFAMAEQDVRYYLNGMLLEVKGDGLYTVAADGHRLALNIASVVADQSSQKSFRIIVPRKGVLELQRILVEGEDAVELMIGPNHLRVVTGDTTLTTKLLEGRFPEYERIIPKSGDKVMVGNRERLKEAFQRASALLNDKFRGVRLRLTQSSLKILAINTEQDEVEEDLEVEYQGEELEIGFNVKYLIDFLNVMQTEKVRFSFSDPNSSSKVEGIGEAAAVYVIMPMRI